MIENQLVSIIMPAYNAGEYLIESIESILNQTYKNFELIIVYDISNDKTEEIIKQYIKKDSRIILVNNKNKGLVNSLNEGIKISRGNYIARMDTDDISYPNRIEEQLKYIIDNSIDILGSYINVFGDIEKKKEYELVFNRKLCDSNIEVMLEEGCVLAHPSVMMKKNVILELGGYKNKYDMMEDYELWIRALKAGYHISNINKVLLNYRVTKDSKSSLDRTNQNKYLNQKVDLKYTNFFSEENIKDKVYIWGCGKGGEIVYKYLKYKGIKIEGFIDSFKSGEFFDKKIYAKEILNKDSFVFIATSPGKDYVKKYLNNIKNNNYIYII